MEEKNDMSKKIMNELTKQNKQEIQCDDDTVEYMKELITPIKKVEPKNLLDLLEKCASKDTDNIIRNYIDKNELKSKIQGERVIEAQATAKIAEEEARAAAAQAKKAKNEKDKARREAKKEKADEYVKSDLDVRKAYNQRKVDDLERGTLFRPNKKKAEQRRLEALELENEAEEKRKELVGKQIETEKQQQDLVREKNRTAKLQPKSESTGLLNKFRQRFTRKNDDRQDDDRQDDDRQDDNREQIREREQIRYRAQIRDGVQVVGGSKKRPRKKHKKKTKKT